MDTQLGNRDLKVGDCGVDVETLNWILKAKDFGAPALTDEFDDPDRDAVSDFQSTADLRANGIFDATTAGRARPRDAGAARDLVRPRPLRQPDRLRADADAEHVGVAHKTLPCGSKVVIRYKGRFVRTTVIDRGPFANGAAWDLTQATARALHFKTTDDDPRREARPARLSRGHAAR